VCSGNNTDKEEKAKKEESMKDEHGNQQNLRQRIWRRKTE
jgi:hypothetical protein